MSTEQGWLPPGWSPQAAGPPGRSRPTGRCFAIGLLTIGIGLYVWSYRVHREMKAHSGQGIGGGLAVLITLAAGIAMPFVTSAEVGALHARRGRPEPVRAWTGLWVLVPALLGYLGAVLAAVALALVSAQVSEVALIAAAMVGYLVVLLPGLWVWFSRTNGALNGYWASLA